jgi:guanosine-3',5'-bis(diphosphate) 3'-pyrophosphohydrolase
VASTVERMLPWRRHSAPPADEIAPLIEEFRGHHPKGKTDRIAAAYDLAVSAHDGQVRKSGEPYVTHPLAVATIVAELGLDDVTVAAALLHDAVEDTGTTTEDVEAQFGPEVAAIVDGVTKLERIEFANREAQQAASMRKMLLAMAQDLRVLVVKLSDRLHNMRTLAPMAPEKQARTAQETLDIYAPLAHRLGMQEIKQQLEDLAFAALRPRQYAEIDHMVHSRTPERDLYLAQILDQVRADLEAVSIEAQVTGRPKHLWSIYEKMVVKGRQFDDIFDLVGIRVVVPSVKDCYGALGSIHASWQPVTGRFKDYVAMPKFNLYQSLHTTVVGPGGRPLEVQIRTPEMHERAELGVAAHVAYKDETASPADAAWMHRILDFQAETSDPQEFMAGLKDDFEQDEVYVFTPGGEVVTLPDGATPIDFAYAIHTEVGHACIGARVSGRLVPLDSKLVSGQTVEIFTSKVAQPGPSRDWLNIVRTPRAAAKIRQWFSRERREDEIESGRDEVVKQLRREGMSLERASEGETLVEVAESLNYTDIDALFAAVGLGHVSPKAVAARVTRELSDGDTDREEHVSTTATKPKERPRDGKPAAGIHVEGIDGVFVRLSRCCTPVPPDDIIGFVTRGRGVSVHRTDCSNGRSLSQGNGERIIDVEWDVDRVGSFVASVDVEAFDRERLLGDVTAILADHHINIVHSETRTGRDRVCHMRFEFELGDPSHLESVLSALRGVDSVYAAQRALPSRSAN